MIHHRRAVVCGFVCLSLAIPALLPAQDIGFVEAFAWAPDREQALKQLIPGTEDYYFYHCLHLQHTQRLADADKLLEAWQKRLGQTATWKMIHNRQKLLSYGVDPQVALAHLRSELGLQFSHQRERIGEKPNLPNMLGPNLISKETLEKRARGLKGLQGFEDSALPDLLGVKLSDAERRILLQRFSFPDHPELVDAISADLKARDSGGFGSLPIHLRLTVQQLESLLELQPELINHSNFVSNYIAKLKPSEDADWQHDGDVQLAYLERLQSFVARLGPAHNGRKAHALYHRLDYDRNHGVYDKERFLAYLQLPRNGNYVNPKLLESENNRRFVADLSQAYSETLLPPIGPKDESLVRDYFQQLFQVEDSFAEYEPFVRTEYLRRAFAETKALYGLGDSEQWASLLSPTDYQALKDRVDLDFDLRNRRKFRTDEPVSLDIHVKNVKELLIKVYYINTSSHARETLQEVNTDIELDGLVANDSQTVQYQSPPLRRVKRHFEFPELTKPGVYVLDFIGNGRSSRAVIRKGSIRQIVRTTPVGQVVTVLNEDNQVAKDALIYYGGAEYRPNAEGHILLPFTTEAPKTAAYVIHHGGQAFVKRMVTQPESHSLRAAFVVNRERLQAGQTAEVLVRPVLFVGGAPTTVELFDEAVLTIDAVDLDGIASKTQFADLKWSDAQETRVEFQTPDRLAKLTFTLTAKVKQITRGGAKQEVTASREISLNALQTTSQIASTQLAWVDGNYVLQLLGRSGEPLADRAIHVELKHHDYRQTVHANLQTDASGAVQLGALHGIHWVKAQCTSAHQTTQPQTWRLVDDHVSLPGAIHIREGDIGAAPAFQVPAITPEHVALFEMRGERIVADRVEHLDLDNGLLLLGELPAGDYRLIYKHSGHQTHVRVVAGGTASGFALGARRQVQLTNAPLSVKTVTADKERLKIQLTNPGSDARVHIFSTRFLPAMDAYQPLAAALRTPSPATQVSVDRISLYIEDRKIGDEYDYILRRQASTKYPGNMLERPSLLLNPWSLRTTDTGEADAKSGDRFNKAASPQEPPATPPGKPQSKAPAPGPTGPLTLDWSDTCVVLANLPVDDKGACEIPIAKLRGGQHVRMVVVSGDQALEKSISLPAVETKRRDLRLPSPPTDDQQESQQGRRAFAADSHWIQQQQVTVLAPGEKLTLQASFGGKFELVDSLAAAYRLLETLRPSDNFRAFRFLLEWPKFSDEQKLERYSQFACHELNFFLYHKDRPFYDEVVAPYLASKHNPTFMDEYLTERDLLAHRDPWRYEQLNVVERILLSHRLIGESEYTVRHLDELLSILPPDAKAHAMRFDTALKSSSLTTRAAARSRTYFDTNGVMNEFRTPPTPTASAAGPGGKESGAMLADDVTTWGALGVNRPGMAPNGEVRKRWAMDKNTEQMNNYYAFGRQNLGMDFIQLQKGQQQLFRQVDKTKEWAENNYYHLPIEQQNGQLVSVNSFWLDYAKHQDGSFLSSHLTAASSNFTEAILALAVLDLPWEAKEHEVNQENGQLEFTAASPSILFHQEMRQPERIAENSVVLTSQNIFQANDRYEVIGSQKVDKHVTGNFFTHTVYGCQIVVTNTGSAPRTLDLLTQIPAGAMPLNRGKDTEASQIQLAPFHSQTVEFYFYFPAAGEFSLFPVHISAEDELLASAEPRTIQVVEGLGELDEESWPYISQLGSNADVLKFLATHNLKRLALDKIAFRMKDQPFYDQILTLLHKRHVYDATLWSYSVHHDDALRIQQYLRHQTGFLNQCGPLLRCELVDIDPVERRVYQHLDYKPLVNARAHQLGASRKILNGRLHQQYHALLNIHAFQPQLDDIDRMSATYYLLVQDRVAEALDMFNEVNRDALTTKLQHDYFTAYFGFYTGDLDASRRISERYKDYPVVRWRETFAAVAAQLRELDSGATEVINAEDRQQRQTALASQAPSFDFEVDDGQVSLSFQNLKSVQVNYYLMDIELLFSRKPFVKQVSGQFSHIQPNHQQTVRLQGERGTREFDVPAALDNKNVLIEITGSGVTKTSAYYSNSLSIQIAERYGQLRVADSKRGKAISKAYIKVFAKMQNGEVKFYKDGYTDLRGRFDYASLSTDRLDLVQQFSVLIMSDEHGATVREAAPPQR